MYLTMLHNTYKNGFKQLANLVTQQDSTHERIKSDARRESG